MEIEYRKGDLLKAQEEVIVHGCNALGVMGAGVARLIRDKWPEAERVYLEAYRTGGLKLGTIIVAPYSPRCSRAVVNMITQKTVATRPGQKVVSYDGIYVGFMSLDVWMRDNDYTAAAMPRIGAGLGGGSWSIISAIISATARNYRPIVYDL
jgi:O-acetyl-ADP-ribose deacetylase (regulator of RNase III)